jgi:hypothetical protein
VVDNINSPDWYLIWYTTIGKSEHPFTGHFDGNGKSISGIAIIYDSYSTSTDLGFFGVTNNAEIKNFSVNTKVIVKDNGTTALSSVKIGGIAGRAINSTIYNCKSNFELSANRIVANVETYKYLGEVVCGGAVGYGQGLKIYQCATTTKIHINQDGINNTVNSYFGGVVGQMDGGEIYFVYVAPSEDLVSEISSSGGTLTAIESSDADVIINNNKSATSTVSFGGIIGYAQNASLVAFNNVYSSLYYTETPSKISCGGIIGRISTNSSEHPQNVTYSKYLNIANAYVSSFSSAIGNASTVSYTINSSVTSFNTMPTLNFYTEGSWKSLKDWDFDSIWKTSSIITYGGYFFPNLQCFSTYNIKLSETILLNIIHLEFIVLVI